MKKTIGVLLVLALLAGLFAAASAVGLLPNQSLVLDLFARAEEAPVLKIALGPCPPLEVPFVDTGQPPPLRPKAGRAVRMPFQSKLHNSLLC